MRPNDLKNSRHKYSHSTSSNIFNEMLNNINNSVQINSQKQNKYTTELVNDADFIKILDGKVKAVGEIEKELKGYEETSNNNKKLLKRKEIANRFKSKSKIL